MGLQQDIIAKLGAMPEIEVDAEIRKRVDFLKDYVQKSAGHHHLFQTILQE